MDTEAIINSLSEGEVGVLPTDTLYGLVCSALIPEAVDRIYELKQRDPRKPLIVLLNDVSELEQFGVILSEHLTQQLASYWPGPYSIILPTIDEQFEYLSRGTDTIAFRIPDNEELRELLALTGPIVAPSANPEGMPPAETAEEAKKYFGTDIDFYIDGGELTGKASTVIAFDEDEVLTVRE